MHIELRTFACPSAAVPLAIVDIAIDPNHAATAFNLALVKVAIIERAASPHKQSIAMLEVVLKLATVRCLADCFLACAVFLTTLPATRVHGSICLDTGSVSLELNLPKRSPI